MDSGGPPASRVAVVVVPGVGDEAPGDTLHAVARGLLSDPEGPGPPARERFETAEYGVTLMPPGHPVQHARLRSVDGDLEVDVYELWWADLSRFPPGLLRFLYTVYALLLQLSTIGLEALRPFSGTGGLRRAEAARTALRTMGWLIAVPVLASTAVLFLEVGALLGAVSLDDSPTVGAAVAAAVAALALWLGWWGGERLRRGGWRLWPGDEGLGIVLLGLALAVAAVVHASLEIVQHGLRVGLGNAILATAIYPFRISWIAASVAAAAAAALLLALPLQRPGRGRRLWEKERARAALTSLVATAVTPLGVAIVGAILLASLGSLSLQVAEGHSWGGQVGELSCLSAPTAWSPSSCPAGLSPSAWANQVFSDGLRPLLPALVVTAILLGLILLVAVIPFLLAVLVSRRERRERPGAASARQGELMSSAYGTLANPVSGVLAVAAIVTGAVGVVWLWIAADTSAPGGAELGAALSLLVTGLLALVRVLGINPRKPFGQASGWLERVRLVLDIVYDVATYLRVSQPGARAPRERMLGRYRTLLRHVAAGGADRRPYDGLVMAAHSQGTVLTAAVLFGDRGRRPWVGPLRKADPPIQLPRSLSLLTAGSPLRQLYAAAFPRQYDWLRDQRRRACRLVPLTGTWVNLYRSGDYVGRTLWAPSPDAESAWDTTRPAHSATLPSGARLVDQCIGAGSHTGYWSDRELHGWVRRLIREAARAD